MHTSITSLRTAAAIRRSSQFGPRSSPASSAQHLRISRNLRRHPPLVHLLSHTSTHNTPTTSEGAVVHDDMADAVTETTGLVAAPATAVVKCKVLATIVWIPFAVLMLVRASGASDDACQPLASEDAREPCMYDEACGCLRELPAGAVCWGCLLLLGAWSACFCRQGRSTWMAFASTGERCSALQGD